MSYILEALRRAESERERKRGVPGLHAQPVPAPASEEGGERRSRPWRWVALGVAAGVLLPLAWRLWSGDTPADDASSPAQPVAGNVTAQANAPAPAAPASAAVTPTDGASAAAQAAPPPAPPPAPTTAAKPPTKAAPKHAAPPKPPTADAARAATPPTIAGGTGARPHAPAPGAVGRPDANTAAAPVAQAAVPEPRLRTLAELPDDMRRSVPALAFGGSVYSDIAAQRMVIFNGQVLREGDPVSDDVTLEQIRPRSAVLRMRGQRFEVPF